MQVKTALIHILSDYEVSSCKDTPVPLLFSPKAFLVQPVTEILLVFSKLNE
jgi:hypothetical protein